VPSQQARDIRVEHRRVCMVGETHHRSRRIPSYPRQLAKLLERLRKDATTVGDAQRRSVQPLAADLVAQRIGDRLHVRQRRSGQRVDRWVTPEEALVDRKHPSDLGLL